MSNLGWTEFDILNANQLYVNGQPFTAYISNLIAEDNLEQAEIDEIKAFLARLDLQITAPNTLTITNDNRNSVLKTAIDLLNSRLQYFDGTALTQSWNLTDDNRNSVLKTRADGFDTNIGTLTNKTRFITTSQLGMTANSNYSALYVDVNNGQYATGINEIRLGVDQFDFIKLLKSYDDPTLSQILLISGKINHLADTINLDGNTNIGKFKTGLITPRDGRTYKIGGANSRVELGATEDPDITGTTTEIYIGKRTTTRNTKTFLQGNIATEEARLTDVTVTDVVTWQNAASWLAGFTLTGVPYFIATFALGGTPSYRYSDVVKMANNYLTGGLTKNGKIETSNDLALKALTIVNTDLISLSTPFDGLLNRLVLQAFAIHGSHSIGTIWGKVNMYAGRGEVELRNDGGIFQWAFKNAGNSNQLVLKDDNVELIQCNGGSGDTGRKLLLGACCGNIEMITGTNGVRNDATKVMEIKNNKQVKIGNNSDAIVDDTYKVLIDAASHTNGIKVVKGTDALLLNPKNISTKTITFQDYPLIAQGEMVKSLYTTENGAKLYYGNNLIAPAASGAGGAGATYIMRMANSSVNTNSMHPMVSSYTSIATATSTRNGTTAGVSHGMGYFVSPYIDNTINSVLHGTYEANIWGLLNTNVQSFLHVELAHVAERNNNNVDFIIDKSLSYINDVFTTSSLLWKSTPLKMPLSKATLVMNRFIMPAVEIIPDLGFPAVNNLRLRIRNSSNDILYTAPQNVEAAMGITTNEDRIWTFATPVSLTITGSPFIIFEVDVFANTGANPQCRQRKARSAQDMVYKLGGSWYVPLYDGVNNKVLLNAGGLFGGGSITNYNFAMPLPDEPYDILPFSLYSKIQLNTFFTQPAGSFDNNLFTLFTGDGYSSHVQTTINIGDGGSTSGTSGGGGGGGGGNSGAYTFVSYTTWSSQDTFQTLPVMDFINYDYEMIMHVANQPTATWLYLFWNGQNSVSHYGELIYTPANVDGGGGDNVTYTSGSGDGFPYWVYSGATAYTGNPTREVYTRYRFRGVNSTKFLMSPEGRPHISWSDNSIAKQPPYMVYKQNTTYFSTSNNANWAPQSIRVAGSGNQLIKMTWLRINKISSA